MNTDEVRQLREKVRAEGQTISWDMKGELAFAGADIDACYIVAELFYRAAEQYGPELDNVRARMRHRFGHNGHGWPDPPSVPTTRIW